METHLLTSPKENHWLSLLDGALGALGVGDRCGSGWNEVEAGKGGCLSKDGGQEAGGRGKGVGRVPFLFQRKTGLGRQGQYLHPHGLERAERLAEAGGGRKVLWEGGAKLVWVLTSRSGFLTFPQHPNTCLLVFQCPLPEIPTPWKAHSTLVCQSKHISPHGLVQASLDI